ncbi:MAG: DUF4145 domain-containing protein [Bacteroidota bacterium]
MEILNPIAQQNIFKNEHTRLNCPHCGADAIFSSFHSISIEAEGSRFNLNHSVCPNYDCKGYVFIITDFDDHELVDSFPRTKIDFDPEDIPEEIIACLEEAIECEANQCYVAAAIMVRKALELLCDHVQAEGKSLFHRLEKLQERIILPLALKKSLHNLRLLGNDAAHVNSKTYLKIEDEEAEISIEITKKLLEAVFQLNTLVQRLEDLKHDS